MSRHIYKASSQADLEAAIQAGIVESPYVAYISGGNTVKMTIPTGSEPATIDYDDGSEPEPTPTPSTVTKSYQIYDNLMHNGNGFYDTSVLGALNTRVQFVGNILNDGVITHGVGTHENGFRIFGANDEYYYDRNEPTGIRIASGEITNPGTVNLMEYGNFYIKRDGETIAQGETIASGSEYGVVTYWPIAVFGAYYNADSGETVSPSYADGSVNVQYFKIYDGNTLLRELVPARDSSNNVGLFDKVNYKFYENLANGTGVLGNLIGAIDVTYDASGNVTDTSGNIPASTYSVAYATGYNYDWDDNENAMLLTPTLAMYNNDASLNYFEYVVYYEYETNEGLPQGYNTWDEFYAAHNPVFITTQSIFGGGDASTFTSSVLAVQNPEDVISEYGGNVILMGRYINGTVSEGAVTNLVSATPWVELGEWAPDVPEVNPAVEYDNYADDGNGEITFNAWRNDDAIGEVGEFSYYKVSTVSESEDAQLLADNTIEGDIDWDGYYADYDALVQTNAAGTSYSGDPENPDSITVTYDPSDPVAVWLVLYDENGSYYGYYSVDSGESEEEGEGE